MGNRPRFRHDGFALLRELRLAGRSTIELIGAIVDATVVFGHQLYQEPQNTKGHSNAIAE